MKKFILLIVLGAFAFTNIQAQCNLACNDNVQVSLDDNGIVTLTSDMLLEGPPPSCTVEIAILDAVNGNPIIPFASTITLDCDYLGAYIYEVRDVTGGNSCWGIVDVQDMMDVCSVTIGPDSLGLFYSLSNGYGVIATETTLNGNPVEEVYDWLDVIAEADLVSGENVLNFPISSVQNVGSSITTLDILQATKVLKEIDTQYPLQAVLADVDGSGYIGVNDLLLMRQYVLGVINDLPAEDYLFFSDTYSFPSDFDIFDFTDANFREYRFDDADVTQDDLYFNVFTMGDMAGVTTPDSLMQEKSSSRSVKQITLTDESITAGEIRQIQLNMNSNDFNINGLQMSLSLSGLELKNVIHNYSGIELLYNALNNSDVRFSLLDEGESTDFSITLELEALESGELSDMISLKEGFENVVASFDTHSDIELFFDESSSIEEVLELKGNVLSTQLEIALPSGHAANIRLFDLQGKLISTYAPMSNKVVLQRGDFPISGMYILSTESNGKRVSKKLVVI